MNKQSTIPTILAIVLLLVGVVAGVFLITTRQIFKLGAAPDVAPQDVRVSNITDTSFTVSWITDKATIGYLEYGVTNSLGKTTQAETSPSNLHLVNVNSLTTNSTYFFKINSAGTTYDNNGIAWSAKTIAPDTSQPILLSGIINDQLGSPANGVIVYATIGGVNNFSAQTTTTGAWLMSIKNSQVRENSLVQLFVQGASKGIASAQIFVGAANPTPQIKLGQTYDFRNQSGTTVTNTNPQSSINIPETTSTSTSTSSGFNVGVSAQTPKTVTLQSTKEGETITTSKPEFFGTGPAGTKITISVHSTSINSTATVDSTGNWNWTPPTSLDSGTHTITLSWKDASGILQTLTRTFIVSASAGPAFASTPSATPIIAPRIVIPSTTSGTPVSGVGIPTIVIASIGILLLATSVVIYIKLEN